MRGVFQRARSILLLSLLLAVAGCSSGSRLTGVSSPSPSVPVGPSPLPTSDAGLAEHVPQQIVIGFLPRADVHKIAAAIDGKLLRELRELNAALVALPQ